MSIEEKAAAYDAVLERAKKQKADYQEAFDELIDKTSPFAQVLETSIRAVENVVPEIKELDKDERVRQELIKLVNDTCKYEALRNEFIGYLERVKKKEVESAVPYIDFVIKPHNGDSNNHYDMDIAEAQEYTDERGFNISMDDGDVYVDERHMVQTVGNILRWADEHPKEQQAKQLTEDDKTKLKNALSGLKYAYEDLKNNKSLTSAKLISQAFNWLRQYFNFNESIYY